MLTILSLFVTMFICMCMYWNYNIFMTCIMLIIMLLLMNYDTKHDIIVSMIIYVFSAFIFGIGEFIMTTLGVWTYSNPTYMLNFPIWIIFSWSIIVMCIMKISLKYLK